MTTFTLAAVGVLGLALFGVVFYFATKPRHPFGGVMQTDDIEAVGIDDAGSLWVKPAKTTFPYIYREAMEVQWDPERACLYSPKPRECSYTAWFVQIRAAAREQGVNLKIGPATAWIGVDTELRQSFARSA